MGLKERLISAKNALFGSEKQTIEPQSNIEYYGQNNGYYGGSWPILSKPYDGEKTSGELGIVIKNMPDFLRLRLRGIDAYVKTDIIKTLTSRRVQWVVGSGMKLECEPNVEVLKSEGITVNADFRLLTEARWKVYANSKYVDYEKRRNFHEMAKDGYSEKFKAGDFLVVCRYENSGPTMQMISGEFVNTPILSDVLNQKGEGNRIEHGIELNARGEHIAYYVQIKKDNLISLEYERVPAYGTKSKRRLAWMVYGQKLTADQKRGVPEYTQVIEKVMKLDRYTDASVSKAEQAANILFGIEHKEYSTGENPLQDLVQKRFKGTKADDIIEPYELGDALANRITQTTSNQTFNLPPGASMKDFGTNIETSFADFHDKNYDDISASVDTPPEVAKQQYNSNYSASRAAINSWGYIVDIDRNDFAEQFYKPFYALWLEWEVLNNKIQADGFINALLKGDFMVIQSYLQCRFVGRGMPHIDPLKEVKAVREMLGNEADGITALISREQASEMLNVGDWHENFEENKEEITKYNLTEKPETNGNNTAGNTEQ